MDLAELAEVIVKRKQRLLAKVAYKMLQDTSANAPVVTGNLRDNHMIIVINDNEIVIKANTIYAYKVHENPNRPGYKWFERTVNNKKDKYIATMRGE